MCRLLCIGHFWCVVSFLTIPTKQFLVTIIMSCTLYVSLLLSNMGFEGSTSRIHYSSENLLEFRVKNIALI